MKITKSELKKIIREELEQVTELGSRRYFSVEMNDLVDQLKSSTKSTDVKKWVAQTFKKTKIAKDKLAKLFKGYWSLEPNVRYNLQTIDLKWWLSKFGIAESTSPLNEYGNEWDSDVKYLQDDIRHVQDWIRDLDKKNENAFSALERRISLGEKEMTKANAKLRKIR